MNVENEVHQSANHSIHTRTGFASTCVSSSPSSWSIPLSQNDALKYLYPASRSKAGGLDQTGQKNLSQNAPLEGIKELSNEIGGNSNIHEQATGTTEGYASNNVDDDPLFTSFCVKEYCVCSNKGFKSFIKAKVKDRSRRKFANGCYVTECTVHDRYNRRRRRCNKTSSAQSGNLLSNISKHSTNSRTSRASSVWSIPQMKDCCRDNLSVSKHAEAERLFKMSLEKKRSIDETQATKEIAASDSGDKKSSTGIMVQENNEDGIIEENKVENINADSSSGMVQHQKRNKAVPNMNLLLKGFGNLAVRPMKRKKIAQQA